jgi:putative spermidine/putrescine transport system substrate-binding protein
MDRRSFLVGLAALGTTLSGCRNPNQAAFRVQLLKNSVPAQFPGEFRKQLTQFKDASLEFKPEVQLLDIFTNLQTWKQQANQPAPQRSPIPFGTRAPDPIPDLVTLGDYWLTPAIRQKLIQPLDASQWQQWQQIPEKWKAIVTRNDQGLLLKNQTSKPQIWGAPYRWGSTVIAYRKDIFRDRNLQPPKDWSDLWREDLRGRISLLDQPRETIGLTLKKLGQSYNSADLGKVPNLEAELQALHRQAKFYSSTHYLQPLLLDDTWVAVGWSTDVLSTMRRNPSIAAVFPTSGTALWADVWVRPANPSPAQAIQTLLAQWINFCWQPQIAPQLSLLTQAASPILTQLDAATFPKALQDNDLLTPDSEPLNNSEFLEPLSETTVEQYRQLWETLRQKV